MQDNLKRPANVGRKERAIMGKKKIVMFGILTAALIGVLAGCGKADGQKDDKIGRASCRERV